jgi:hypothetical protein
MGVMVERKGRRGVVGADLTRDLADGGEAGGSGDGGGGAWPAVVQSDRMSRVEIGTYDCRRP